MGYKDAEAQRAYQREWMRKRRRAYLDTKECDWCGTVADLELHHRDPNAKVHHAIWSWSEKRRQAEIDKCIILCGTCHDRAHAESRRVEAELHNPCGTWQAYKRGCRCDACRCGNAEYQRELKSRKDAA